MKRILLMAAHFHPYKGGLENFALDLATRLVQRGHAVDVMTFNLDNMRDIEKYRGITIYRLPCISILGRTYTFPKKNEKYEKMGADILATDYDDVITNTRFFTTSWLGHAYAKRLRKRNGKTKHIHIEHGNVHVIHSNPFITAFAWLYDQTLGRIIFRGADVVVGVSKPCAEFAKRMGAKRTEVIHNSIDVPFFERKARKRHGDKAIIAFVGRLIYAKGVHDLIDSVAGIHNIQLRVIGDGPYRGELEKMAALKGVDAVFLGTLPSEGVRRELHAAAVFVNPSYSEGLPTSVLEAGAASLPIIATDVGGTSEIITNNVDGMLVNPKDIRTLRKSIIKAVTNNNISERLGAAAHDKIKKQFDWSVNIRRFEGIL